MKVLVTGGAGFVGSHIVEQLLLAGHQVRVFDDLSSGRRENLAAVAGDVELIVGDILDFAALSRAMRGAELVSHMAAQLEIVKCNDDPAHDLQVNTVGTLNVLRAAVEAGAGKLVQASSACVYGQAVQVPECEDTHPTDPNWAYGVSKLANEKYGRIFQERYGMPVVSLRYGITYGPREWYGRVLTIFLKRALQGEPPVIFGQGDQVRDFICVRDVVHLHNLCLFDAVADGQVFNAGTGIGTTVNELAEQVVAVTGLGLEPIREDVAPGEHSRLMPFRVRLPQEMGQMVLDPRKAERLLGWKPAVSLEAGVREEWQWLKENPRAWETYRI
jgi:UDP-glucose 4-epimerase